MIKLELLPWTILFLPLIAAGVIALFTLRNQRASAVLSIGAILAGFGLTLMLAHFTRWGARPLSPDYLHANWLSVGPLAVDFGLKLDPLSLVMLLIVTGVGGTIQVYSTGYMRNDPGWSRYFACMSLFTFSMLGIVLADNFLQLFIFWELVGLSSYLLIGFWFEKGSAADAAKKAFLTNRLGDFGFLLGILLTWGMFGALGFDQIRTALAAQAAPAPLFFLAGLLIFCGAVGKSAQFPLHVWLPDAMEGPTPVSALIHAATMVAAGVYMLCRVFFIIEPSGALPVVAWIGGITALLAALIAVQQNDIKRILAYSTLSQLGYMVMAVGLAGPASAMFHLATHAFFKALLFLGAGSVIIALHHEQDIWKMGGLRRKMPVTFWTFLFGALALCGVWPFSGFYSKDGILALALQRQNYPLLGLGVLVAVLTSFYVFRLFFVAFLGEVRTGQPGHAQESPPVITWPLRVLAVMSLAGGVMGLRELLDSFFAGAPDEVAASLGARILEPFVHSPGPAIAGLLSVLAGFLAARAFYRNAPNDPLPAKLGALATAMSNRFYFDEFYQATFIRVHDAVAKAVDCFDRWIVEGACIGLARGGTDLTGRALRLLQTGNLQNYAFLMVLGVAVVLWWIIGK